GTLETYVDENGHATNYSYDPYYRLIKIVGVNDSPLLPTEEYVYNFGDYDSLYSSVFIKKREKSGLPGTFNRIEFYDGKGRKVSQISEGKTNEFVLEAFKYNLRSKESFKSQKSFYHSFEQPSLLEVDALKGYTTFYDALLRPLQIFNPEHSESSPSLKELRYYVGITEEYDEERKLIRFFTDSQGRKIAVEDHLQNAVNYSYNDLDKLVKITDPQGSETRFTYDSQLRRTCKLDPSVGVILYQYNSEDLVIQKDHYGFVTGQQICSAPASVSPRSVNYSYNDPVNRLTEITYSVGSNTENIYFSY